MKPAAAFSIGLWTGAAVIAAIGLFYVQGSQHARSGALNATNSDLSAESEQIRLLQQENARLNAEVRRLKETASTLNSNLEMQAAVEPRRRIPFVPGLNEAQSTTPEVASESWIVQVVAGADTAALPQLEKMASRNNRRALEALALLADQDQAVTLTRVWRSGALTLPNLVEATRYLAATLEVNPDAEQLLRGVATDPNVDARVLYAAVDGLANPSFPVSFTRVAAVPPPPHFKPDYARRIRVLDGLRSSFTDDNARAYADQAKTELQTRWTESNPTAP
jgi:cell division protein FtsB